MIGKRAHQFGLALTAAPLLLRARHGQGRVTSDDARLSAAADWLLEAQRVGAGGYAHSFNFLHGWQPAYPETTGYILPTLRRVGQETGEPKYRESVAAAARWLLSMQNPDGSFGDLQGRPQVFDTGQILIGFNDLAEHVPELCDRAALRRAAHWLAAVQEADGSFIRHAYNGIPHAYYARVGAALTVAGRLLNDGGIRDAGIANLRWTVAQQQPNGFFRHLSFDASAPYLHTMVYVIEGLMDGAEESGDLSFQNAAELFARHLHEVSRRDRILKSQYGADYSVANREKCLTGLAQWAAVCFRLARLGDASWRAEGEKTLAFVRSRQILSTDVRINGGLPGSAPILGRYMRAAIPNWGMKFYLDALLETRGGWD